jgi:hypothetical protein
MLKRKEFAHFWVKFISETKTASKKFSLGSDYHACVLTFTEHSCKFLVLIRQMEGQPKVGRLALVRDCVMEKDAG